MTQSRSLDGKIALVTGAAHTRGMGAAACRALAAAGATIVATDIAAADDRGQLETLCSGIAEAGGNVRRDTLDVTDVDDIARVFNEIEAKEGGVDILFNNAGLGAGVGPFLDIDPMEWDAVWSVNVMGMVRCCRAAIPQMQAKGGGAIVNNASLAGLGVVTEMAGYSTSKFAVVGLTKSLAAEFGADGIRCNAVCPGTIRTAMYDLEIENMMRSEGLSRAAAQTQIDTLAALGRSASAEEVADAVVYLAGPGASYITGVALPVAGGMAPGL